VPRPAHTNNKPNPPRQRRPLGWVDHHIVGSLPGCTAHFQNPETGYATNYGIGSGDGRGGGGWWIHEYVPADQVAWGNGNDFLNEYGVSVEHENNLAAGIAAKPVHEVHELSARLMAAMALRFDWRIDGKVQLVVRDFPEHDFYDRDVPGFGTEFNVITHRSVALKDCPRDLDIHWKAARANQIIAAGGTITQEDDMAQGAFYRRASDGSIFYQREPGTPLIGIDGNTWAGYAAQGNKYADLSATAINSLIGKAGLATKPEPTSGTVTTGDVTVSIDYQALAEAFLDAQAARLAQ
jgi:hypothetical protein